MRAVITFLVLTCGTLTVAADVPNAGAIIKKDGHFTFTDGSSYYRFDKGGAFEAGPVGMSGRTIKGTWKADGDYGFVIEGVWGWMNGSSAKDDRRRMRVTLQPPFEAAPDLPLKQGKVHKCYAVIDELTKLK